MEVVKFYKKYIQPFVALLILVLLIFSVSLLSQEHKLKREISENCGWEGEDYECMCRKGEVIAIQNQVRRQLNGSFLLDDVELDR